MNEVEPQERSILEEAQAAYSDPNTKTEMGRSLAVIDALRFHPDVKSGSLISFRTQQGVDNWQISFTDVHDQEQKISPGENPGELVVRDFSDKEI